MIFLKDIFSGQSAMHKAWKKMMRVVNKEASIKINCMKEAFKPLVQSCTNLYNYNDLLIRDIIDTLVTGGHMIR